MAAARRVAEQTGAARKPVDVEGYECDVGFDVESTTRPGAPTRARPHLVEDTRTGVCAPMTHDGHAGSRIDHDSHTGGAQDDEIGNSTGHGADTTHHTGRTAPVTASGTCEYNRK